METPNNPYSSLSFPNGNPSIIREALDAMSSPIEAMPDVVDALPDVVADAPDLMSEIWEHLAGLFY